MKIFENFKRNKKLEKEVENLTRVNSFKESQLRDKQQQIYKLQSTIEGKEKDIRLEKEHGKKNVDTYRKWLERGEKKCKNIEFERDKYLRELEGNEYGLYERHQTLKNRLKELEDAENKAQYYERIGQMMSVEISYLKKYATDDKIIKIADKLGEILIGYTGIFLS